MPASSTISTLDRYRGCLLGGAVGDALGAAVEFLDITEIRRRFGRDGITRPARAYGRVGAITDDTQMTLFTAEGILQADDRPGRGGGHPPANIWFAYQRWLQTQGETSPWTGQCEPLGHGELHRIRELNSRRAPGNTCLSALKHNVDLTDNELVADNHSKGCGGVMRAAPCGLVTGWFDDAPYLLGVASAAWNWCWYGRAAEAIGELAEARDAYREALRLEELDETETDAAELSRRSTHANRTN
jgi:hypothetical protein